MSTGLSPYKPFGDRNLYMGVAHRTFVGGHTTRPDTVGRPSCRAEGQSTHRRPSAVKCGGLGADEEDERRGLRQNPRTERCVD